MVISLAFGVLLATGVTLLLVPALYLMAEDVALLVAKLRGTPRPAVSDDATATEAG